jgi:hypothetical protein
VQSLVTFAVVLAGECFATDCTNEWALVCVGAEMGAKIVSPSESLWAEIALEVRWVFLDASRVGRCGTRTLRIGKV